MANWTKRLRQQFRTLQDSYRTDLSTPENRRRALAYQRWFDHGFLRSLWSNMHQIAPGVWRSNHPTPDRFEKLAAQGIKTIVSLRGNTTAPWALLEAEACANLGITLKTVALQSRVAPQKAELQRLIALFRQAEKPLLFHCKSGADRAGLASAIYLMVIENHAVADAQKMLSLRYLHFRASKAGVLDQLLKDYAASDKSDFEAWLSDDYDSEKLQRRYDNRQQ